MIYRRKEKTKTDAYKFRKCPPLIFFPSKYTEVDSILSEIKNGRNVIVNVSSLKLEERYRIIDFLSGYISALDGFREKLENSIYLFGVIKN